MRGEKGCFVSLSNVKHDDRPMNGAWAPGNYLNQCNRCGEQFIGDKRAVVCADCAYGPNNKEDSPAPVKVVETRDGPVAIL